MRVLYIRTNDFQFDSRVSKELTTLSSIKNIRITLFGWNRNGKNTKNVENATFDINGIKLNGYLIDIFGPWGRGARKNFLPLFRFMKILKKWLKNNIRNFDVVHCVDLATAYYAIPLAKKYNVKVVYDIFDYFPDVRRYPKIVRSFFVKAENKCINKADVTIICSEARLKQIGKAKPKKIEIIHNSPQIDIAKYDTASPRSQVVFAYIGNLVNDRLIDLILHYFSKNQNFILNIGGIGALSEMAKKYSDNYANINYFGPLKYSKVLEIENESDVIIALYKPDVPNHKYVAANKFYEALALGKQIIMCAGTGMDDEIEKYNFGVLIEPNFDSFHQGVQTLLKNKSNWPTIGNYEKEIFEKKYSWTIMASKLIKIYSDFSEKHD